MAAGVARRSPFAVEVYDPVPAPIARIAGRERGHLLVQAASREELQRFLDDWEPRLAGPQASQVRWASGRRSARAMNACRRSMRAGGILEFAEDAPV